MKTPSPTIPSPSRSPGLVSPIKTTGSGSHANPRPSPSTQTSDDEDEDAEEDDGLDDLGREKAGGGNRGKRVKLAKLIIYHEGMQMLDLVVAANMGVFWKIWHR